MTILLRPLAALAMALAPTAAFAAVPLPEGSCEGLIGCGAGASNVIMDNLPDASGILLAIAGGAGVLFIVWAGLQMIIALGNDGKISEQKNAILHVLIGLSIAAMAQSIVSFAGTQMYGQGDTSDMLPVTIIGNAVSIVLTVFNAIFVVAIFIGGLHMVYAQGKSETFNTGRKIITWSVVGAVVANLANALVQAIAAILSV